jgi:VWFA-related protein
MRFAAILILFSWRVIWAQTTFRAGVREVSVEAAAVDRKGNFQRDLTQDSFKLWSDGKEQKITSFSLEGEAGTSHSSRHFVALVFESEGEGLRDEVCRFVDRYASPDLYLAVYSRVSTEMHLQQAFTSDGDRIKTAVRSMEISAFRPPAGRVLRENPVLTGISSVTGALSWVRGRKALVLFGISIYARRGPGVPTEDQFGERRVGAPWVKLIDDLNAANVSLHAFAIGRSAGISTGDYYHQPRDGRPDQGGETDVLRDVAAATGGRYTPPGTYDLAAYLGSVTREQNEHYLLGFTPPDDSGDKPCHKLKVKVDRSNLRVEARDSYCTSNQLSVRALNPTQKALEARVTSDAAGNVASGMQLSWFYAKPGTAVVDLAMNLDLPATKPRGKPHGDLNVVGIAYREDGSVAARVVDKVELDFDAPYRYARQFDLAPGRYRVRVAAGTSDAAFASVERQLDIAPWDGQTMSISGIALSLADRPLTDVTAELDSSMLEGPRRLASKGREIVPMGGTKFAAGKNGWFYFEIYRPAETAIHARILDGAGAVRSDLGAVDTSELKGNAMVPMVMKLPVSELAPGAYTLEVRAGDVVRRVEFDVTANGLR